jgi:hypothetical protein
VSQSVPQVDSPPLPPDFIAAHKTVLADKAMQFHLEKPVTFQPPEWLGWFKPIGQFFEAFAPFAQFIFWGVVAMVVAIILYFILREFVDIRWPWAKKQTEAEAPEWLPDAAPARALLAEADALAANGRYGEAAHLILLRSVEDIERRRPKFLKPSSTAREIAGASALPDKARATFALIARHVEASLFGGQGLDAGSWTECREAYGRFALAGEWR